MPEALLNEIHQAAEDQDEIFLMVGKALGMVDR
jgi:hypothetical protein